MAFELVADEAEVDAAAPLAPDVFYVEAMSETRGRFTLSRVSSFSPFLPGLVFHTIQDLSAEALSKN